MDISYIWGGVLSLYLFIFCQVMQLEPSLYPDQGLKQGQDSESTES